MFVFGITCVEPSGLVRQRERERERERFNIHGTVHRSMTNSNNQRDAA